MKKNMMRLIAILLTLVLLMSTLISFAETAEETSGEAALTNTWIAPELTISVCLQLL